LPERDPTEAKFSEDALKVLNDDRLVSHEEIILKTSVKLPPIVLNVQQRKKVPPVTNARPTRHIS
jgi:hypothetical protein